MKFIGLAFMLVVSVSSTRFYPVKYSDLGCWKDTEYRAIPTREGDPILGDSNYGNRVNAMTKCARVAHNNGDDVFALQAGGWCASSYNARSTYRMYGESDKCKSDGKGGSWGNQVYELVSISQVSLVSLGCWKDTSYRAITLIEGLDRILDGDYKDRQEAIEKCVQAAYVRGYNVISLQDGGQCAGSRDAEETFMMYGPSTNCDASGKGGSWANEVYRIDIEVTTTY